MVLSSKWYSFVLALCLFTSPLRLQSLQLYQRFATGNSSFYCKYNNHTLQAYSAIMHFTGALASIPASYFTQHWGRKG